MKPLISIVVPAYNIKDYLGKCIDSILNQTYQRLEIIIIDDGSTDGTSEVGDKYVSQYPKKIKCIHTLNSGVSNARMKGIKESSGEWIGFVDGDDLIDPDMYERLINNAIKYDADISHCGYRTYVNENRIHYFYNTGRIIDQDNGTALKDLLEGNFIEPGLWNKIFRKELFDKIIITDCYDCSIKYNEDLLMNFFLFKEASSLIYEDFCPYQYMVRESSATRKSFAIERILDPIKVKKTILEHVPQELKTLCEINLLTTEVGAYEALIDIKSYKDKVRELKNEIIGKKHLWKYLNKKNKIKIYLIMYVPSIYKKLYRIYEKYFQDKIYE